MNNHINYKFVKSITMFVLFLSSIAFFAAGAIDEPASQHDDEYIKVEVKGKLMDKKPFGSFSIKSKGFLFILIVDSKKIKENIENKYVNKLVIVKGDLRLTPDDSPLRGPGSDIPHIYVNTIEDAKAKK